MLRIPIDLATRSTHKLATRPTGALVANHVADGLHVCGKEIYLGDTLVIPVEICPGCPSSAVRRLILVFWRSEIVALQRVAQVKRRSSVVSRIVIEA